nr:hypothetical protein [Sedimentibacter sp.]
MSQISMQKPLKKDYHLTEAWKEHEKELQVRGLSEFSIITKNSVFIDFMKFCDSIITMTEQPVFTLNKINLRLK